MNLEKETNMYEVGIISDPALHVVLVTANRWEIIEGRLTFYRDDEVAVFTSWIYVKRLVEAFVTNIFTSTKFVSTLVKSVKDRKGEKPRK